MDGAVQDHVRRCKYFEAGVFGKVDRILEEFLRVRGQGAGQGQDGMVHISQLDTQRVNKVEDVVNVGDEITVMVIDIEDNGRIRLSRQAVLEGWTAEEAMERDRAGRSRKPGSSGGRGDRRGGGRSDGRNRR